MITTEGDDDVSSFWTKLIGDKKHWKAMEARAEALPRDYVVVYEEIKDYSWRFTSGDGMDVVAVLETILEQFEAGASRGEPVRQVTGEDVAAYCDRHLQGTTTYVDQWRASLNGAVSRRLAE